MVDLEVDGPTLKLVGDFDVRSTSAVRQALYEHMATQARPDDDGTTTCDVVVDLADVHSIDATALRVLAVATRVAERNGYRLLLRGCSPSVRRMLTVAKFRHLVSVEPIAV